MRRGVIRDHPGPDWGKSRLCLCASPILFSYSDTLMPVMHQKQSAPMDIILTPSCVNNSAWARRGVMTAKSHIQRDGYSSGIHESWCWVNGALWGEVITNLSEKHQRQILHPITNKLCACAMAVVSTSNWMKTALSTKWRASDNWV